METQEKNRDRKTSANEVPHIGHQPKNHAIGRQVVNTKPEMKRSVISHMRKLQKSPLLVCSFFQTETTRYAA
jgi:hypothetical protein